MALDENGDYYQQKIVTGAGKEIGKGERDYVKVNNQPLKFIPIEIACDEEIEGELPQQLGFLNPIADLCLHRYNTSADYKEALRKFVPTTDVYGMTDNDVDAFYKANGRRYRAIGQTNLWPSPDIRVETTSTEGSLVSFENYSASSLDKLRSMGAVVPDYSSGDTTATEALINSAEQNAVLNPLVSGVEKAIKRLVSYCAMFEGLVSPDAVSDYVDQVNFDMPRDFSKVSPNVEAGRFVIELVNSRLMTVEQATKKLIALGWHEGEIDELLASINNIEPDIVVDEQDNEDEEDENQADLT